MPCILQFVRQKHKKPENMINLTQKALTLLSLSFAFLACQTPESETPPTDAEITELITMQVDSLYAVYERFDFDWIEFYADDYTAIYPETPISITTKDSLKAQWERIYAKYDVKLISRGRPTIIPSQDLAVSYNSFNEIFVNKETKDTINNIGTYIINWKRQDDDSWKIVFETLHNE